jgi:arylsulfatase A-like enzyme
MTTRRAVLALPAALLLALPAGAAPDPAAARRPNILVLMGDDWSWPHAGALGDPVVKTPTFDRLAREGVLFENAFVSSPSCTPSRMAVASGQWHWRLKEGANLGGSLGRDVPVYPDLLHAAGYRTGFARKGAEPSKHRHRGSDPFGPRFKTFEEFLEGRAPGEPFCFWYGAGEPHRPYIWETGAKAGLAPGDVRVPPCLPDHPTVRTDLCDYYEAVQRFDRAAAKMLARLERACELDDTIVVMTGDNGMPFPRCKATLYDTGTRVPLAVRWGARVPGGRTVSDFVSLTDLAPTFLKATGLPTPPAMTGRSLLPILRSDRAGRVDPARSAVLTGVERHVFPHPARALRTDDHLYILNVGPDAWPTGEGKGPAPRIDFTKRTWPSDTASFFFNVDPSPTKQLLLDRKDDRDMRPFHALAFGMRPAEELYDLKRDPHQLRNVASDPAYAKVRQTLRSQLESRLRASRDPRFPGGS